MPWTETDPMTERHNFILALDEGLLSMTELCERFGISRKTGYKWLNLLIRQGIDPLPVGGRRRSYRRQSCKTGPVLLLQLLRIVWQASLRRVLRDFLMDLSFSLR